MPEEGLEPSSLAAHDFESCVFANFITRAQYTFYTTMFPFHCQSTSCTITTYEKTLGTYLNRWIWHKPY